MIFASLNRRLYYFMTFRYNYRDRYDRRDDHFNRYDRYGSRYDRRDRHYYDNRRKRDDSPRRDRWRDSPKRGYDKYSKNSKDDDNSSDEAKYEKKPGDASKVKKPALAASAMGKKPLIAPMKGKLPFIGRLPLFKKKDDPKLPEKDITPLPYTQSKFEDTPKVIYDY